MSKGKVDCLACGGTGKIGVRDCAMCNGTGKVDANVTDRGTDKLRKAVKEKKPKGKGKR